MIAKTAAFSDFSGAGHFDESAEAVDELHLIGGLAVDVEEAGIGDHDGQAAGARDGHVQAVAAEDELDVAGQLGAARRFRRPSS